MRGRFLSRAQTELLGAILVFGVAITVLVSLQVFAVPLTNERVEFSHNLDVQGDVGEVSTAVFRASTTGVENVVTFDYGTTYPSRAFLRNPPPASGSLSTTDLGRVTLSHVSASGEANDYVSDTTYSFRTTGLTYRPSYNEYANAPTTRYEYPVTYNVFANGNSSVVGESGLVRGDRITLTLVSGNFSRAQVAPGAVHVVPVSAPAQSTTVTNAGDDPMTLRLPTHLDEETWESVLADQRVENGGHVTGLAVEEGSGDAPNTLVLTFEEDETYQLRLARVAVDYAPQSSPSAAYLVETSGDRSVVGPGGEQRVVVQARDRYNNPVSGARVEVAQTDLGANKGTVTNGARSGDRRTAYTGEDGYATFYYTAPQSGLTGVSHANFTLRLDDASSDAETVPLSMELRSSTIIDVSEPDTDAELTVVELAATAEDASGSSSSRASAEQVTLRDYEFTSGSGVTDVSVRITRTTRTGPPWQRVREIASRDHIAAKGNETLGFDGSYAPSSTVVTVTVTATDNAGDTVTCRGEISRTGPSGRISVDNGGFTCTHSGRSN
ncbi:hypothetical protein [Halocalculus aciditolerans]|uniref:Big-1 domain-containing protein n=1 Tax=Halocalculus aciditolerans TaxID=1383812 RepID=A0A830FBN2_9EURY|nr:hypothetical protein [Halocalculus aciditolerans]GGL58497.1 hypothetical protein GCM10009039_15900 [Halocalculus aciditolerans]